MAFFPIPSYRTPTGGGIREPLRGAALTPAFLRLLHEFAEKAERGWCERSAPKWLDAVEQLPAGDVAAFEATRATYQEFLSDRLRSAEAAWFQKTYENLPPGDFAAAWRVRELAKATEHWAEPARDEEVRWVQRVLDAELAAAEPQVAAAPRDASARLRQLAIALSQFGTLADVEQRLSEARRRAVHAWLDSARRQGRTLIAADRFQAAADAARQFDVEAGAEAEAVGAAAELAHVRQSYTFLAELARQARKSDPQR